jgi:quinol monooxygenase YgiN
MREAPDIPCIRLAEIEIDPVHRDAYMAALSQEIETALRVEPGVLTLHAVPDRNDPARIVIFEMYANAESYHAHLVTPHFLTYKAATAHMVRSLKLTELSPSR